MRQTTAFAFANSRASSPGRGPTCQHMHSLFSAGLEEDDRFMHLMCHIINIYAIVHDK